MAEQGLFQQAFLIAVLLLDVRLEMRFLLNALLAGGTLERSEAKVDVLDVLFHRADRVELRIAQRAHVVPFGAVQGQDMPDDLFESAI